MQIVTRQGPIASNNSYGFQILAFRNIVAYVVMRYQFGAYAQSTKTELMPNIAVYCKTPLLLGSSYDPDPLKDPKHGIH